MRKQPNSQVYRIVVIVWLTLSAASVVLAAVTWVQLSHKLSAARVAVAIQSDVDAILNLLVDTESAQRGFTITGDESFLTPLREGEALLPQRFEHLAELTCQDSALLKRVIDLRAQAERCLNYQ